MILRNLFILFVLASLACSNPSSTQEKKVEQVDQNPTSNTSIKTITHVKDGYAFTTDGEKTAIPGMMDHKNDILFMVRHAEKQTTDDNSKLTDKGQARAEKIATILDAVPLHLVCFTKFRRAMDTAGPTVMDQAAPIVTYTHKSQIPFINNTIREAEGQRILLVGHSNTIPELLNHLGGTDQYKNFSEEEYDNFFIVSVNDALESTIMPFKY